MESSEKSIQSGPFDMLITRTRGQIDTRIFSPLTVPRLCVPIGHYWYLFKRLAAVSDGHCFRFEHIVTYSSGKIVAKKNASRRYISKKKTFECYYFQPFQGFLSSKKYSRFCLIAGGLCR